VLTFDGDWLRYDRGGKLISGPLHRPIIIAAAALSPASRAQLATVADLCLRKRTIAHLPHLSDDREYLVARYDPVPVSISQLNRLHATPAEVADRVPASAEGIK
jgi:hypothetical protein